MKNTIRIVFLSLFALAAGGCFPSYLPISSHTIADGENTERDVVWVTDNDQIYRCRNSKSGPVCEPVSMR
ncbi:MAG: hypothetical protein AAGA56_15620 [Myxococcota bacterium]